MSLTIDTHNLIPPTIIDEQEFMIKEASDYHGLDYSFFSEALEYCKEIKSDMRSYSRDLYHTIHEAQDIEVVNEAFTDFIDKVKEIIKKFLDFLKKLFNRFIGNLHSLVKSDKYLRKKKELFSKFGTDQEFEIERYEYTHIYDSGFPSTNPIYSYTEELQELQDLIENSKNDKYKVKVDNEKFYDKFRYEILNPEKKTQEGTIRSGEYNERLFEIYRDGGSKKTVYVTADVVNSAYSRFAGYDETVKSIKRNKSDLEKSYKQIENDLKDIVSVKDNTITVKDKTYEGKEGSTEYYNIESIVKSYVDRVSGMTTIHLQAFGSKLDAVTECYKEDKKLLYKALNKIQKTYVESVDDLIYDDFFEEGIVDEATRTKLSDDLDRLMESTTYVSFLISEACEQDKMLEYINNEVLKESGVKYGYLTEAEEGGKIKNTIDRVLKFLGKLWGKFKEFIAKVFENDKKYLERYKTIILQKPLKDAEFEMYNYTKTKAIDAIVNTKVQRFDYNRYKTWDINALKSENFIKRESPYKEFCKNPDVSIAQNFVDTYSGEKETIQSSELNMTDIFNFIYTYKSDMVTKLEKEYNDIGKEAKAATDIYAKLKPDNNSSATPTDVEDTGAKISDSEQESSIISVDDRISNLLEDYFGESDVKITSKDDSSDSSSSTGSTVTTSTPNQDNSPGKIVSSVEKEESDQKTAREDSNKEGMNNAKTKEDLDKMNAIINVYFDSVKGLITGKTNLAKRIYNDYFKIIRWHVQQYNGTKDRKDAEKPVDQATDYTNKIQNDSDEVVVDGTKLQKVINSDGKVMYFDANNQEIIVKNGHIVK